MNFSKKVTIEVKDIKYSVFVKSAVWSWQTLSYEKVKWIFAAFYSFYSWQCSPFTLQAATVQMECVRKCPSLLLPTLSRILLLSDMFLRSSALFGAGSNVLTFAWRIASASLSTSTKSTQQKTVSWTTLTLNWHQKHWSKRNELSITN